MTILSHTFLDSTMLDSGQYDTTEKELVVQFKAGRRYTYVDVDKSIWDNLISAKSAGKYFNSIKNSLTIK